MSRISTLWLTWPALVQFNAHIRHSPKLSPSPDGEGDPFLEYVGNGHFGLAPPYAAGASHWSDGDATDFGSEKSHDLHDASFYIRGGNQVVSPTNAYFIYICFRRGQGRPCQAEKPAKNSGENALIADPSYKPDCVYEN